VQVKIPSRRYASHIALVSSINEPSSCLEEERCDTLMEDVVGIVKFTCSSESHSPGGWLRP
jgi:hypothetical protein